jgi:hypothetical protein
MIAEQLAALASLHQFDKAQLDGTRLIHARKVSSW